MVSSRDVCVSFKDKTKLP